MTDSNHKLNYNETVNPTFNTGQATLEMLAGAGNPDAIEYKRLLGIGNATERVSGSANAHNEIFSQEEGRALMMGVTLGIEARYAAVSRLLKESGYKSMLDIACGYTPRALMCRKEGIDYVGVDLPAVVERMEPLSETLFSELPHPAYVCGDVTNAESLKEAADLLDGEVFISSEGLMAYLNRSELKQTILAIRQILTEHGGAWYSSDMDVQYERFAAEAINKPDVLARWAQNVNAIKEETNIYFFPASFASAQEKIAFFEELGLKVEQIPFYTDSTQLNLMYAFDPESQERLKNLMKSFHIWKITAADEEKEKRLDTKKGLDIQYKITDRMLSVKLDGRLDTLSAPELMELLDQLKEEHHFSELVLDLQKLEYMSSTGIRILLMMKKQLGSGHIYAENLNEAVRDLFETTGFAKVVAIR